MIKPQSEPLAVAAVAEKTSRRKLTVSIAGLANGSSP